MSDLGRLFRLSHTEPKPLENFTTAALAIAVNHDQRPFLEALKHVDRSGHETDAFPVLDRIGRSASGPVSVTAEVQSPLSATDRARKGFLDLVVTVQDARRWESAIWVEVKVDAWESGDQILVYLEHASHLSPKPDVITLGRTEISKLVPFLTWDHVVRAIESVSNPHYMWVSLREFLHEEKIVRPRVQSPPSDATACIELIVDVNRRIRHLWPDASMAWRDGALRNLLQENFDRELIAVGGEPLVYGLAHHDGIWEWCLRVTVAKNQERVRLEAARVLEDARQLPVEWARYPDQPELLERRLPSGTLSSHDDIVRWFEEGLQQLHGAGVLNSYLTGLAEKRARKASG